jgi:tetratricopeptide (TPR) repeat protein
MTNKWLALILLLLTTCSIGQSQAEPTYDVLSQQGKAQLQAGNNDQALASAEQSIKSDATRWEGYALAGGALMNLKRYEEAADRFSKAIELAPQSKQDGLRELSRQCFAAESGAAPSPPSSAPATTSPTRPEATTTQAEIVLWKSIENSTNTEDFKTYLSQYPNGAFAALARRHLADAEELEKREVAEGAARAAAGISFPVCISEGPVGWKYTCGDFNAHPGGVRFVGQTKGAREEISAEDFSAECSAIQQVELGHNSHILDFVLLRASGKSYYLEGFQPAGDSTGRTAGAALAYIKRACP